MDLNDITLSTPRRLGRTSLLVASGALAFGLAVAVPALAADDTTGTGTTATETAAATEATASPTATESASPSASASESTAAREDEVALEGGQLEKVKAAVLSDYPGATFERVETDSGSAAYEAHIVTAEGERLTVLLDEAYAIVGTEQGRGGAEDCPEGAGDGRGRGGERDGDGGAADSTDSTTESSAV